ncbi:hypothetical protein COOONC_21001 [Cooperia oncophora]
MWMIACVVLMIVRPFITRPTIYNSAEVAHYVSVLLPIHNISVVVILVVLYSIICCYVATISRISHNSIDKIQIQLFIQALLICASTATAAGLYIVLVVIPAPKYVVIIANAVWQFSHGVPGIVLICLNKHIREDVRSIFWRKKNVNRTTFISVTITVK